MLEKPEKILNQIQVKFELKNKFSIFNTKLTTTQKKVAVSDVFTQKKKDYYTKRQYLGQYSNQSLKSINDILPNELMQFLQYETIYQKMIEHHVIVPFSNEWVVFNVLTIITMILVILIAQKANENWKKKITQGLSILFIIEFVGMEIFHLSKDLWFVEDSLPLHMCAIMWFVTIYLFITKSQWAFELMLYIGMPGGIHSLLTPELTQGVTLLDKIDYFLAHGGLVMAPFYAIFVMDMWPRKNGIWRAFFIVHVIALFVGLINWILGSNYMYLAQRPIVDNPLIPPESIFLGRWPYYIIIFQVALLLHALVVNLPFWIFRKRSSIEV